MINSKTILIDNNYIYTNLEKHSHIQNNLQYLIGFMIKNNMTELEQYTTYNNELVSSIIEYGNSKKIFESYIKNNFINKNEKLLSWNLNFQNGNLDINYSVED